MEEDPLAQHPKYEMVHFLGEGSFGTVVKARRRSARRADSPDSKEFAIKFLKRGPCLSRHVESELIEHSKFWHPHVVALKEIFLTPGHLAIVLELVPGGDLYSFVRSRRGCSEKQARWIFQQLVMSIDYVHKMGVSQRDIKLENTLVVNPDAAWPHIKITDFGYCKGPNQSSCKTLLGTSAYMAPEVIMGNTYNGKQADMWSCGVMLYVLLYCRYPFELRNEDFDTPVGRQVIDRIMRAEYVIPRRPHISESCRDLLQKLLTVDPLQRLDAGGCQQHPWFQEGLPPNALGMNADCLATSARRQTQQSEDQIRQLVHQARSVCEPAKAGPAHSGMDIDVGCASDAQVSARAA